MEKTNLTKKVLFIISGIIVGTLLVLNITLAIMSSNKTSTGIIQFKQHKLDIDIVDSETIFLKPEELGLNTTTTKTVNIKNPSDSISCVLRIWLEFKVEDEINLEYLNLEINSDDFVKNEDGKIYYKKVLNSNGQINDIKFDFKVVKNPSQSYVGKKYSMKVYVESLQSTQDAVKTWDDGSVSFSTWYNAISENLT